MRLLRALAMEPLDRPPVWFMRQAGRYLPEYRQVRSMHSFLAATHTPAVATEITLQPVRRFGLDAAIVFSDIMTPLGAMGVAVEFNPGPSLAPHSLDGVAGLPELDVDGVDFVAETLHAVRGAAADDVAVIGFAGAPFTLLAYLMEGSGSKDFMSVRGALAAEPARGAEVLKSLAASMRRYLEMQVEAGADVVQLFDSWAGLASRRTFVELIAPAARTALDGLDAPTIYFAPHAPHLLDLFPAVGATGYGVDWRQPIGEAWDLTGRARPIQGNLDPAVLLGDQAAIEAAVAAILDEVGGAPGHVFNLGHGIHPTTPPANVEAMVSAVKGAGS